MKKSYHLFLFIFMLTAMSAFRNISSETRLKGIDNEDNSYIKTGSVIRLSPLMDDIIPPGESPEILAKGFGFTEGPLWLPEQNILLFSDIYLKPGKYKLSLAIVGAASEKSGSDHPVVQIGIKVKAGDGWYPLSELTIR